MAAEICLPQRLANGRNDSGWQTSHAFWSGSTSTRPCINKGIASGPGLKVQSPDGEQFQESLIPAHYLRCVAGMCGTDAVGVRNKGVYVDYPVTIIEGEGFPKLIPTLR